MATTSVMAGAPCGKTASPKNHSGFLCGPPAVKREPAIARGQESRSHERASLLRRVISLRVFDDEQRVRLDQRFSGIDRRQQFSRAVGSIEKNHVERSGSRELLRAGKPSA